MGKESTDQWADDPLELCKGWTEIWEFGQFLGMFDCLASLEAYVQARPNRQFVVRFIQRPIGSPEGFLRPMGGFFIQAGERTPTYTCPENGEEV